MSKEYPTVVCSLCGKSQKASFMDEVMNNMVNRKLCFNCLFWTEHWEQDNDPAKDAMRFVVTERECGLCHQMIAPQPARGEERRMLGFGGSRFLIEFIDGRKERLVISNNLWHQGDIPSKLFPQFKVNARTHYPDFTDRKPDEPIWELREICGKTTYVIVPIEELKGIKQ